MMSLLRRFLCNNVGVVDHPFLYRNYGAWSCAPYHNQRFSFPVFLEESNIQLKGFWHGKFSSIPFVKPVFPGVPSFVLIFCFHAVLQFMPRDAVKD